MALIQMGGGILDARGSIGGQVFSRNRFGNYIRARTTPVNPASSRQNAVRTAIQSLSQRWANVLTAAQRAAWEVYASAISRQNKLGAAIKLTGFNMYVRSNTPRVQAGATVIDAGPTTLTLPPADTVFAGTVDETNQEISVAFDTDLDWVDQDNGHMLVYMSEPKSAGVSFIGGPWRYAGKITGDSTTPPTSPQTFSVPFPVAQGQVVAVRARISEEDGRLTDLFRSQSTVAA